jgi:tetratricopeptide (TPR) repeat protein
VADPVEGVVYRAEAFLAVGQIDRAETLLRDGLGQRPDDPALLLTLAKVFEARRLWPDVISTATAALEANPNSLNARMMIAWAAYQVGDRDLMKLHVDEVLSHRPDQPTALMYLALHAAPDRSTTGKRRTRDLIARSLEHGGGGPWFTVMAAKLEVFLGGSAEARRLVDDGLAQNPTDAQLLTLKADLASTTTDESIDIVSGLLATSPADPSLRSRFDALVANQRRGLLVMLWVTPALVALGVWLTSGGFRIVSLIAVAALALVAWGARLSTVASLPAGYRRELDSKAPWRVATRYGGGAAAVLTVVGGVLLAVGVTPGAWVLACAVLGWVVTRFASLAHERAVAASADAELESMSGTADADSRVWGPATRGVVRGRWSRAFYTPLLLVPLCFVGLIPPDAPDEHSAARAVIGVIAAVVGLMSLAEAAPWARDPGRPATTFWRVLRLGIPGVLLALVLVGSLAHLTWATSAWAEGGPPAPSDDRTTPATISPDYLDNLQSPAPAPTIDIPDFDLPDIDIPSVPPTAPPVDPEG